MARRDYTPSEEKRMFKHIARFKRAAPKASPERLAEFERHMSARTKLRTGKQVAGGLFYQASERAMNLSGSEWNKFDDARRTKKVRDAVRRKLGIK